MNLDYDIRNNMLIQVSTLYDKGTTDTHGAAFGTLALRLYQARDEQVAEASARRLFGFSIVYLFLLFAALLAERLVGVLAR